MGVLTVVGSVKTTYLLLMDLLDKMDAVLKCLYLESGQNPTLQFITSKLKELPIDLGEIRDCLQKLHKDGFLYYERSGVFTEAYDDRVHFLISFDGKLFYESEGGYKAQKVTSFSESKRITSLEDNQDRYNRSVTRLTFWVAFASVVSALSAVVSAYYYLRSLCGH